MVNFNTNQKTQKLNDFFRMDQTIGAHVYQSMCFIKIKDKMVFGGLWFGDGIFKRMGKFLSEIFGKQNSKNTLPVKSFKPPYGFSYKQN